MKPLSIFVKTHWVALVAGVLCSHAFLVNAAPVAQLPGAQQQRMIDTEARRQQKLMQLDALQEKKKRDQEEASEQQTPLVVVPEEMKKPHHEGGDVKKGEKLPESSESGNSMHYQ